MNLLILSAVVLVLTQAVFCGPSTTTKGTDTNGGIQFHSHGETTPRSARPEAAANVPVSYNPHYPGLGSLGHGETTPRPAKAVQQSTLNAAAPSRGYVGQVGSGYPGGQSTQYGQGGQGTQYGQGAQGTRYPQGTQTDPNYMANYPGMYPWAPNQGAYPAAGQQGYPGYQGGYQNGYQGGYNNPYYGNQQRPQTENTFQDVLTDSLKKAGATFIKKQITNLVSGDSSQPSNRYGGYQGQSQYGGYQQQPQRTYQNQPQYPSGYGNAYQGGYPSQTNAQGQGGIGDALSDSLKKAGQAFVSDAVTKLVTGQSQPTNNYNRY